MVDAIDSDGEPPPELVLAWHCERWNCLPEAGGLYEQDCQTMYRMAVLLNIHQTLSHLRNCAGEQIHALSNAERKTLKHLVDLGLLFHA